VDVLKGIKVFCSLDHLAVIREVRIELQPRKDAKHDSILESIVSTLSCNNRRTILLGQETGQWLLVMPSVVNGTQLLAHEYQDALLLCYARSPADLQSHCDGCGQKFSVRHALGCKKGGLVISRYKEIQDKLSDLASKALIPSAVCDEPRIYTSRPAEPMQELDPNLPVKCNFHKDRGKDQGDVLIRGLWARGTNCIINVRITDVDAALNRSKDPHKVLNTHEREKKKKYLKACLKQRRHFTLFVVSTDGLLGREAKTLLKNSLLF
jgi:hypothetical protein